MIIKEQILDGVNMSRKQCHGSLFPCSYPRNYVWCFCCSLMVISVLINCSSGSKFLLIVIFFQCLKIFIDLLRRRQKSEDLDLKWTRLMSFDPITLCLQVSQKSFYQRRSNTIDVVTSVSSLFTFNFFLSSSLSFETTIKDIL